MKVSKVMYSLLLVGVLKEVDGMFIMPDYRETAVRLLVFAKSLN